MMRLVLAMFLAVWVTGCASTRPAGLRMEDVFVEIVRADPQTAWQCEAESAEPPAEYVAMVRKKATFRRIDLDGDGEEEQVISLNHEYGQKQYNQQFHIARRAGGGWAIIGETEGDPRVAPGPHRPGMPPLEADWYLGGHQLKTTHYEFKDGRYVAVRTTRWTPVEDALAN